MRFALVNPNWDFKGSTYFGCQDPHVPLELLFAQQQIRDAGHEALVIDDKTESFSDDHTRSRVEAFDPDFLIIPSAPSYLFWRCPPPELRIPREWFTVLGEGSRAHKVLIGPHSSATPAAALRKTKADVALRGEPDQTIAQLVSRSWESVPGACFFRPDGSLHLSPELGVSDMKALRALTFDDYDLAKHWHRHHVFFGEGRGAELEFARGCPWSCTFCNKTLFRNKFRERNVEDVLKEVDQVIASGAHYIYFIDEIFGVGKNVRVLLEEIAKRPISIGFQSRIDLWDEESLDLLGRAHTISMECGIESITAEGRDELNKNCRIGTHRISELLIYAKQRIPWVQANLILTEKDNKDDIHAWQENLKAHGVWVSEPVPMFPFPGSPLYLDTFGAAPDDKAWERAHHHYLSLFSDKGYSDIQEQRPVPIEELECAS
ncbi:MAG: TIGR04295 family B12-binding domain-containing radical SAM protein [Acidobacteriaceae bacterium]